MSQYQSQNYAEHHFRKVVPGGIETARRRLCEVLESFDHIVLSENPLQARRPARRGALTANVLEYDIKLTIALKEISPASTVATFNYGVPYLFAKSERLALEREADAMIALLAEPIKKSVCPACGSENDGIARFCRACGTPIARNKLPAELEVMRLMAGTSAAQVELAFGVVISLVTLLIAVPLLWFGKSAGWSLLGIGQTLGVFYLLWGLRRLYRTINANALSQQDARPEELKAISTTERDLLPAPPTSVVEGTTELMEPQPLSASAKPARETGALD
jgi:ribosomal protein L40E